MVYNFGLWIYLPANSSLLQGLLLSRKRKQQIECAGFIGIVDWWLWYRDN